jgi:AraC-like DNA-binding protein
MGEVFETTDVELAEDLLLRHYGTSAYRWGFHSPGRFAVLYRQAYGVPPSHTIHQN